MSKLEEEKKIEQQLLSRLKEFSENDPAVLEEKAKEASVALDAANRWTDNIFSIQSWIKKKFPSIDQVCIWNLYILLHFFMLRFKIKCDQKMNNVY